MFLSYIYSVCILRKQEENCSCFIFLILTVRLVLLAPYGIREATRRTGSHKDIAKPAEGV